VVWPRAVRVLALAASLTLSARASATQCRAIAGGSEALANIDAETRLHWLDRRLAEDATRARIWAITWNMAFGTVVVVQLAVLPITDGTGARAERIVAATTAGIGVLAGAALPLKIMGDQRWWEKHLALSHGEDPCALLNTAELLLLRGAESEEFGISPIVHFGNFAINIAAGLFMGLGYDRWNFFAYSTIVGIVVGELQIATQPTDAIEDLRLYRAGELTKSHPPRMSIIAAPIIRSDGGGALFGIHF
jgi:hypothetical protein